MDRHNQTFQIKKGKSGFLRKHGFSFCVSSNCYNTIINGYRRSLDYSLRRFDSVTTLYSNHHKYPYNKPTNLDKIIKFCYCVFANWYVIILLSIKLSISWY